MARNDVTVHPDARLKTPVCLRRSASTSPRLAHLRLLPLGIEGSGELRSRCPVCADRRPNTEGEQWH